MNEAIKKIALTLSFQPAWLILQSSIDLMHRIEEFSRRDIEPTALVVFGETGCGVTTVLRAHYLKNASQSVWLGARILADKATFYDRLAKYVGIYNVTHKLEHMPKYLLKILELRQVRTIYIDDIDQFVLDKVSAQNLSTDISYLSRQMPVLRFVVSMKLRRSDAHRSKFLDGLNFTPHEMHDLSCEEKLRFLAAMLDQLNALNGTAVGLASAGLLGNPPGTSLADLIEWVKLAYVASWLTGKEIDLGHSCAQLWRILNDFM